MRVREQITLPDGFLLTLEDYRDDREVSFPQIVLKLERSGIEAEIRITDIAWRDLRDRSVILDQLFLQYARQAAAASRERFGKAIARLNGVRA